MQKLISKFFYVSAFFVIFMGFAVADNSENPKVPATVPNLQTAEETL